jgi:hypothetical protein
MANAAITHHFVSETVWIDAAGVRYRATRSSAVLDAIDGPDPVQPSGRWTLWHDVEHGGGSHSVGSCDAFDFLDHAIGAASLHGRGCSR